MKTTSLNQVDRVGSPKDNMAANRNRPSKIAKPRNNLQILKPIRSLLPLSQVFIKGKGVSDLETLYMDYLYFVLPGRSCEHLNFPASFVLNDILLIKI
jgi:hypothetical protein